MAPLPPDSTGRFKVKYEVGGHQHDFQIRATISPSDLGTLVGSFLTALSGAIRTLTVSTVEFAASGTDIFLPVTSGIEGGVYGAGTGDPVNAPNFLGFVGRSASGRRWHMDVFGAVQLGEDYRFNPGEDSDIDAGVAILQGAHPDILGIDNTPVTVYSYVNVGVNAHWQRALRP